MGIQKAGEQDLSQIFVLEEVTQSQTSDFLAMRELFMGLQKEGEHDLSKCMCFRRSCTRSNR